jgi:hypothetical protein
MFRVFAILIVLLNFAVPARAAPSHLGEFTTLESVQKWMYGYRAKPEPGRIPDAIRTLNQLGALKDPETSGIYIGFLAGVIGANPDKADEIVAKLFPVPPAEQWVVVRAIAYSGHPQWKHLMLKYAARMPARKVMIDKYLARELATLKEVPLEHPDPGMMEKLRGYFSFNGSNKSAGKDLTFENNPELLDTLWGYYFANGSYGAILRVVSVLPWSKDRNSVDKLNVGSMAKYTLSTYAMRDPGLLEFLKTELNHQPKEVVAVLKEVIEAADTADVGRIRKEALAAVEELKRKGPGYKRDISFWGQVGEGAVSLGCVAAAALGQIEFGIPCVLGGAATSAAVRYWSSPQ